ncbi:MAG TPA: Trm112 family protein [Woeseiaceae bacterium]|jgi:uncharacterized protein YbaR (Trm112 family)|nr:Trm112 family protein [Woeseiaceae bacterium]|tara:strand:+ start:6304 stop:6573 length:270 start_codon:yes stop_codon:yes gene_type:complete
MKKELLSIICCPITKQSLSFVTRDKLDELNKAINKGLIKTNEGNIQNKNITDALITDNGMILYPIKDDIPVLLENKSIHLDQLEKITKN